MYLCREMFERSWALQQDHGVTDVSQCVSSHGCCIPLAIQLKEAERGLFLTYIREDFFLARRKILDNKSLICLRTSAPLPGGC